MRSALFRLLLGLAACALLALPPAARCAPDEEVQVEAAFMYNFTKFVTWPDAAFQHEGDDLVIGVMGASPFGGALEGMRGVMQRNHPIALRQLDGVAGADRCHLLFIARSMQARVPEVLAAVQGKPVLTVSDTPGFAKAGGIVEFVIVSDTVRFRINLEAARRGNLKLSSQMLGVALEVIKR